MRTDSHPDAERVQIELLRRKTPAERLQMAIHFSNMLFRSSRQTIAARNPDLNPRELGVKCVELFYGKYLAEQVRDRLRQSQKEHVHHGR